MDDISEKLEHLQAAYKAQLENWIETIRREEELVSAAGSLEEIDRWEQAHFDEEDAREKAKALKSELESALREKFFGF